MKHILKPALVILLLAAWLPLNTARGEDSHADPLAGAFFPPEMIFQAKDQIDLSQDRMEALRTQMEKTQARSEELRKRLETESAAFAALAKQERVDEKALVTQLDKVLDAERDLKHLHIALLAAIKNQLTVEQQAKLRELAKNSSAKLADDTRKRLTEKVEKVKAGMQKWAEDGRDPSAIAQEMEQKFKPLIEGGKIIEAEAELDHVLELLKQDAK